MVLTHLPQGKREPLVKSSPSHAGDDVEAISQELEAQGQPSIADLGRIQVRGTLSWWRLHRKRKNILAKLG
ncbi:hypothetical protein F8O07_07200 [Pseudoclavibacter sp. CFCC 13796]|nr:hypothetical protein F8O07_07200 [Pseudoclavibacter sp. CFCC 13796]